MRKAGFLAGALAVLCLTACPPRFAVRRGPPALLPPAYTARLTLFTVDPRARRGLPRRQREQLRRLSAEPAFRAARTWRATSHPATYLDWSLWTRSAPDHAAEPGSQRYLDLLLDPAAPWNGLDVLNRPVAAVALYRLKEPGSVQAEQARDQLLADLRRAPGFAGLLSFRQRQDPARRVDFTFWASAKEARRLAQRLAFGAGADAFREQLQSLDFADVLRPVAGRSAPVADQADSAR